ncbi:ubiquitin carboxyl-terminal hydrolase 15-like [Oscarella lobularis]|uniref:ubiquitin carboxyl-terminal hydrolase 15-like n=1 Tax=Oscarella lobularis TaxID=121494 RepID=UPI0033135C81
MEGDDNNQATNSGDSPDDPSSSSKSFNIDDQFETIRNAVNRAEMREGDTWYIVDSRWFKQWKRYVGWDTWDQSSKGNESAMPGPIDNSNLLTESGSLKQHLTETFDFVLLSEIAWKHLVSWFGVVDGQSPIERTVIQQGLYVKSLKVEVYLTEVKLNVYGRDKKDEVKATFSRAEKLRNVIEYARKALDVDADKEVRVWSHYMSSFSERLDKYEDTLQDHGIYSGQALVFELKNDDGTWPKQTELSSSSYSSSNYGNYGSSSSYQDKVEVQGLTGLSNLGNTCFMNSVLQCLSNVPILTEYFLTNEYKGEINRDNPLGMRGHLAESYGELMHEMWSERAVVAPRRFKSEVGKFAPRFLGSKQPDSQELLVFLLNGLHEDLNRVIGDGRPDEEVAAEAWKNHLRQNRSVIVDCIQGQYKSTLVCPDCGKASVIFDPFMYLTLPLPVKKTKRIPLTPVRQDPMIPPKKNRVSVEGRRSKEAANHTLEDESWSAKPAATAVPTLHDWIKCFTEQKSLSEEGPWYCSKCKKNKQADKTTTLWKLPEVLVVHLQRFSYSRDSRNKLDTYVDFPIENLDMTEFVKGPTEGRPMLYDLCAVSNHYGGLGGGHYTAYCKNKTTGDWYHFDDSNVTKVHDVEATVRSKAAYLLIYLQKNLKEEREAADDLSSSQQIVDDLLRRLDEVKVENEGQMAKLQGDNQQLRERATQAETDLEKTANLLAESKKQCDDLEAEKARVSSQLSEEITGIRAQLTESARRCTDLEAEKTRVSSQLSEENTRIRAQLIESARRCTDLEAEKARVSSQLSEENTRILAQRAEAEERCSRLEQERDETRLVAEEAQRNVSIYEDVLKVPATEVEMSDVKLGGGAYGEVRVGYWRGCRVAVKTFYDFLRVDKYLNRLEQEISICRHAHHPNVVSLLGAITEDGIPLSILSELLEGSLSDVIEAADGKLTLREQIDVAVGCSAGVGYLHGLNVLHGDIRSSNVVVTSLMEAKICDLGAARFAEHSSLSAGPMSPNYIAPERLEVNQRNTKMADVYSLGVTFIELMTGREPAPMKRMTQATSIRHALMRKLSLGMVKQVPRERLLIGECLAQLTAVQKSDEEYQRCPAKRMVKGKVYGGGKVHLVKEPWIG